MPLASVRVEFVQRFRFPAAAVYAWATDYTPGDIALLGMEGRRKIQRICNDTLMLTDTFIKPGGRVTKRKLIRLFPEQLSWTNTTVAGPNKFSQFLYRLVDEDGGGSRLEFTGRQIVEVESTDAKTLRARGKEISREDAGMWKILAKNMAKDLKKLEG